MSRPKDTCLQCGQTREEVKREGAICATATGYEVVEMLDEWDRHHWRDWSDAELKAQGIHPSLWDANRRTDFYDLEWPARTSICMENGHKYPDPWHPPMSRMFMYPPDVCLVCYETRSRADVSPVGKDRKMSEQQLHDYYYPHVYADFLRNAGGHQLEVLHDDGLYRHLRFKTPGSLLYHFDIITWPGSLVTKGDIADGYVFSRDVDMLDFFDEGQPEGHINPSYWAEKLARESRDVEEFSKKKFQSWLRERLQDGFQIAPGEVEELTGRKARLVESVDDGIALLDEHDIPWDYEDPQAWYDYRYHFILTLHAILWGARKYHERVNAQEGAKV